MSTEKAPDYKGIAERLAAKKHPGCSSCESLGVWHCAHPDKCGNGNWVEPYRAYASCMEARLRSDWETIRLLRTLPHSYMCERWVPVEGGGGYVDEDAECDCGLSAHLSKLLEPFTP